MTRSLVAAAVVAASAAALVTSALATPEQTPLVRFQTPSKNIGCLYSPPGGPRRGFLRCDILSGVRPRPQGTCRLDWTGYTLEARGRARPTCAGDTVYARGARILRYGTVWRRDGLVCVSRRTALRCSNPGGRGFSLSRARSFAF